MSSIIGHIKKRGINSLRAAGRRILYYPGWQTSRKIVVIESDDWGSLSIPSKEAYEALYDAGIEVDGDPYCTYDGLAGSDDLRALFDVLTAFRDRQGRHPVITANTIVANPVFSKIRASKFKKYHYELFTETLKRNPRTASAFDMWEEGMGKNIFFPQFHGREHLQVSAWLTALQRGNKQVLEAFRQGTFIIPDSSHSDKRRQDFRAAFDIRSEQELVQAKESLTEGLRLFEQLFEYRSDSFIAPCYTWSRELESVLYKMDVTLLQGLAFQQEPVNENRSHRRRYHYLGKRNKWNQSYSVRNVFFEPVQNKNKNLVSLTLKRIGEVFRLHKPAIIGSHRLNYIGAMSKSSRDRTLNMLSTLLETMLMRWPDIEFLTSADLALIIRGEK